MRAQCGGRCPAIHRSAHLPTGKAGESDLPSQSEEPFGTGQSANHIIKPLIEPDHAKRDFCRQQRGKGCCSHGQAWSERNSHQPMRCYPPRQGPEQYQHHRHFHQDSPEWTDARRDQTYPYNAEQKPKGEGGRAVDKSGDGSPPHGSRFRWSSSVASARMAASLSGIAWMSSTQPINSRRTSVSMTSSPGPLALSAGI